MHQKHKYTITQNKLKQLQHRPGNENEKDK